VILYLCTFNERLRILNMFHFYNLDIRRDSSLGTNIQLDKARGISRSFKCGKKFRKMHK